MQLERHRRPHLTDGTGGVTRSYGILGNPYQTKTGSTVNAQYTYTSDGTRVKAVNGSGTGYVYRGSFVYSTTGSSEVLESVGFGGGRIEKNGTGYEVAYHITDHLGSVRSIVKSGTIVEQNDYYPYGSRHANSALTVQTSPAPNRWRFSGKEDLSAALGDPVLDFGARMYSSTGAMWQTQDPLAEKYYGVSQYVYCVSNPLLFIDTNGMDWYSINSNGDVEFIEEREDEFFDMLFLSFEMGPPDYTRSIKVKDRSILKSMSNAQYVPYSASVKDLRNIFFFVSDSFMEQEWGLYSNEESYAIVTSHSHDHVSSPFENTKSKLHSHSDTAANDRAEYESMGYWFYYDYDFSDTGKLLNKSANWYGAPPIPNDYYNYNNTGIPSQVYFPKSGHVYQLNKNNLPTLIETRRRK